MSGKHRAGAAATRPHAIAAAKPAPRTVTVEISEGDFAGWRCVAIADFPARVVADLESGKVALIFAALDRIILEHNFPDEAGELAGSMADVDPLRGVVAIAGAIAHKIESLPNR